MSACPLPKSSKLGPYNVYHFSMRNPVLYQKGTQSKHLNDRVIINASKGLEIFIIRKSQVLVTHVARTSERNCSEDSLGSQGFQNDVSHPHV